MPQSTQQGHAPNRLTGKLRRYSGASGHAIAEYARNGIKTDVFYELAESAKIPEKNLAGLLHISPRTIGNYKEHDKPLNPVHSEHLLKLVLLYEKGEELFSNVDEFNYWLRKPLWNSTERPLDWLVTPGGIDVVIAELVHLAHGDVV